MTQRSTHRVKRSAAPRSAESIAAPKTLPASIAPLLNTLPVAIVIIGAAGEIVGVNHAAELLFNRSSAALCGLPALDSFGWLSDIGFAALMLEPSKSLSAYTVDLSSFHAECPVADIVIGQASPPTGQRTLCIHAIPASGRGFYRRQGAAARSASAAAAMLAHEIKNPLSGIKGAAQLLGKGAHGADSATLAQLIVGEVDRIASLIDSMQSFTRDAKPVCTTLNIYPSLTQARDIAAQGFAQHFRISETFDPSLPPVSANHDALVQILLNLLKNAAEAAMPNAAPHIRLTTAYRHGLSRTHGDAGGSAALPIEIAIGDNGAGIDEGVADSLFDPFVTSKADGQGLGLALVEKLMRDMGGFVHHERHDGWTWFRLNLPLAGDVLTDMSSTERNS
ncbi:MAG: ATP-binding protein [Sphingopyxis sp.]